LWDLALTQALSSTSIRQPTPKHTVPLKVIAVGDSLIYGFGDVEGGGWVERLRRQWMQSGPILYNLGVRGDTVRQVAQRLEDEFRHRGELRHQVPDRIILSVGVNDSARLGRRDGRTMTPFPEFQARLADLLDRTKRLCPVAFVGMVPVNEAKMPFLDTFFFNHDDQHLFNEATRLACQERQIPFLDLFDQWQQRGKAWCQQQMSDDGLHPHSQGYQMILTDVLNWKPLQISHSSVLQFDRAL
jgi:lysophospholipase L1-like esterase